MNSHSKTSTPPPPNRVNSASVALHPSANMTEQDITNVVSNILYLNDC